jgi:tetratricopeptide (TPR) repeat protein
MATGLSLAEAQTLLVLPEASQGASVTQRLGITDVTISYHRPLVGGRKVWGGLVPYDQVWRAGANENTTINFTDPVSVEGELIPKGTYGLHMIPGTDQWTIIFSKNSSAWGSFTYKQDEDALRVKVKPQTSEMREALAYDFDDVKADSAAITMRWEKLAVPFKVSVNEKQITMASLRDQLRGGMQYTWEGPAEAAIYSLTNKVELEQGLKWADDSIAREERYDTFMLKAQILDAMNKSAEAAPLKKRALEMANATQLYFYGRQLQLVYKQPDEAMGVFRQVAAKYPEHWLGHISAARLNSASGNYDKALAEMKAALTAGAPDAQKPGIAGYMKRLEAHEDINK